MTDDEEDQEFQKQSNKAGEVFKNLICGMLGPDQDFEPNEVISGGVLALCVAHISMRPSHISAKEASQRFIAMAAYYLSVAARMDAEARNDEDETSNLKKVEH